MNDKDYLKNGVKISFETLSVGILEVLESEFGFLWGCGKNFDDLTEEEQYYRSIWDRVRAEIFQKAHKAKNITFNNVDKFVIKKTRIYNNFRG